MENISMPSREEMEQMIEKAKRDLQETLAKMTPEERAQAEIRAKKMIEEDEAARQKLMDEVAAVTGSAPKNAPKFCGHCGAPAEGGKFCAYCGMPL